MRRSGAAGVDQRMHARAHGHVRQLDDTRLEHEIGPVPLAEPEPDAAPAGGPEAHGSRLDQVGPADLHVLQEVASRGIGHDLPAGATFRQRHCHNAVLDRCPIGLEDTSLQRGRCDPLRAERGRGRAQRQPSKGEQSEARAHRLGRSRAWNRGVPRSTAKLGSTCTSRKRT